MSRDEKPIMRSYGEEDDFWRIREFLRDVFLLNHRLERSWSVPRLDYWRWHYIETCGAEPMREVTYLWETAAGQLAAVLHSISTAEAYMHVHPHLRSAELENEMLAHAEERFARPNAAGEKVLFVLADEDDETRRDVLALRGYTHRAAPVFRWRRDLDAPVPAASAVPAYTVRSMGGNDEYDSRAWASWRAFHPDDPDDDFEGGDWYANLQSAPLYRRDLDVVAEAPSGEIAAFSTIWYDDVTRSAVCVLVGTAREHQRRGLGKAVLAEGLRRLQSIGATRVFANGFDPAGNALYGSVLGTSYRAESWFKKLD